MEGKSKDTEANINHYGVTRTEYAISTYTITEQVYFCKEVECV